MKLKPLAGLLWIVAAPAVAEEVAIPVAKQPFAVEVAPRAVPQRMLVPEALRLFESLRLQIPAPETSSALEPANADAGVSRVFEVEVPATTNPGTSFAFQDVTDRSAAPAAAAVPRSLTIDQRRAAVEAFRRALAERRAKGE